jgi:hypothetical protein
MPRAKEWKVAPGQLLRLFNELVFTLLGALLMVMALSGRYAPPGRSIFWILLGVVLVYRGARTWIRTDRGQPLWASRVGAGSLALVGAMVLATAWLPFSLGTPMLAAAGAVLVLRGVVSMALYARSR